MANKGRTQGTAIPYAPMQVTQPPTQQYYCANPIIAAYSRISKGRFGFCVCKRCGYYILRRFCLLDGPMQKPTGDGCSPTPEGGPLSENRHKI